MKKKIIAVLFFFVSSLISNQQIHAQDVWTVGPMLHINFGDQKVKASFSVEAAYWNFYFIPYSVDFGLEFEKQKIRIYSEFQTGIVVLGGSIGPVLEFNTKEQNFIGGIQASVWANYVLGINLRYRKIGGKEYLAPGIYGKLPVFFFDKNDPDWENRENNSSAIDDILDIIF
ncbi:MAG: hypothetical protein RBS19_10075 [Bacteroidales bacterium]|nr:hypothetical protein [Bacteroidales bacterium]MDY0217288.1 hypothetical protein [Bacteroidales bacterium]